MNIYCHIFHRKNKISFEWEWQSIEWIRGCYQAFVYTNANVSYRQWSLQNKSKQLFIVEQNVKEIDSKGVEKAAWQQLHASLHGNEYNQKF